MIKPNQVERRKHPRVSLNQAVDLKAEASGLSCYLKDISVAGAAVVVDRPLPELEVLAVRSRIEMPELPVVNLDCEALVIRCDAREDGHFDVGLFFHQISERERQELEDLVHASSEFSEVDASR